MPPCRQLRLIGFAYTKYARAKRCRGCGATFRPVHANATAQCVDCNPRFGKLAPAPCRICKQERPPIETGVPLCIYCASDPEKQKTVVMALRRGQLARQQEHRGTA